MSFQVAALDLAALEPYNSTSPSALRWVSWGSNEHAAFLGVPSTAFQPLAPPAPANPAATIDPKQKHAQKMLKPKSTSVISSLSTKPSATAMPYVSSVARRKQHFTHLSPAASTTSLSSVHSPITSDSLTTLSITTNASSRMPELAHVGVIDIKFLSTQKLPREEKKKPIEKPKDDLTETPSPPPTSPPGIPSVKRRGGAARAGATPTAGTKAAPAGKGKDRRKPGAHSTQNDEDDGDKEKKEREVPLFRFLPPSQQPTSGPYIRYSSMYHPYHPFRSMHREAVKKEREARNPPPKPEPVVEKEVEEPPAPQRRQSSRQKKQATRLTAAEKKEKAKEAKERAKERAKEKALKAKEAAKEKAKEAANSSKTELKEAPPDREPSPPIVATRSRAAAAAAKTAAASKSKSSGNAHSASGDPKADSKSGVTKGRASRAATAGAKRKREEDEEQATEEVTPPPKRPRRGAATRLANANNENGSNDALDGDEQAQDNASQEGSSNDNLEEHSASSPTGDPPNGDKLPQRRMRPGTRKTQAARAAAMAAKVRHTHLRFCDFDKLLMGEGQKRSLAERENKTPGDESMELDQDGIDYEALLKVEAVDEEEVVPEAAAAPSPPPAAATTTTAAPAPTPKTRGRGGKSKGGASRGRASAKRRTAARNSKAPHKEAEEERAEEHEAEHAEEHVEDSHEVYLRVLCARRMLVDFTVFQNRTGADNEANPPGEDVTAVKADE